MPYVLDFSDMVNLFGGVLDPVSASLLRVRGWRVGVERGGVGIGW